MPNHKTPARLKALRGNPGKRPIVDKEPVFELEIPPPPDWTKDDPAGLAIWERVTRLMADAGMITGLDFAAVDDFVYVTRQLDLHRPLLKAEGYITKTKRGGGTLNPRARLVRDFTKQRETLTARLGFSPTMRAKITAVVSNTSAEPETEQQKRLKELFTQATRPRRAI